MLFSTQDKAYAYNHILITSFMKPVHTSLQLMETPETRRHQELTPVLSLE